MIRQTIPANTVSTYEIALIRDSKVLKILGYTARRTKRALLESPQGQDLTEYFTEDELDSEWKYSKDSGVSFGNGSIRIAFTGNTDRTVKTLQTTQNQ